MDSTHAAVAKPQRKSEGNDILNKRSEFSKAINGYLGYSRLPTSVSISSGKMDIYSDAQPILQTISRRVYREQKMMMTVESNQAEQNDCSTLEWRLASSLYIPL